MYRDYKKIFSYEAQGGFAFPRDISVQEFMKGTRDLLSIIAHHYESLENFSEEDKVIKIGTKTYAFKSLENERSTETLFNFIGEIPFRTHHCRGFIRTGFAETHPERYAVQFLGGLALSLTPSFYALTENIHPLWTLTGLIPALGIATPGFYKLTQEEKRKDIKTLELELHVLEKRATHSGQVENLLRYLQGYRLQHKDHNNK